MHLSPRTRASLMPSSTHPHAHTTPHQYHLNNHEDLHCRQSEATRPKIKTLRRPQPRSLHPMHSPSQAPHPRTIHIHGNPLRLRSYAITLTTQICAAAAAAEPICKRVSAEKAPSASCCSSRVGHMRRPTRASSTYPTQSKLPTKLAQPPQCPPSASTHWIQEDQRSASEAGKQASRQRRKRGGEARSECCES